jgi:flagellar basal-body rod protein FlgB
MSWLTDPTQRILAGALTGLSTRQELIAGNIANIDTPGYRPASIDFESTLRMALSQSTSPSTTGALRAPDLGPSASLGMARSDARHFKGATLQSVGGGGADPASFDGSLRNDTNTVDLESEMTALAESQLKFSAVATLISGRLGMLNDVVAKR